MRKYGTGKVEVDENDKQGIEAHDLNKLAEVEKNGNAREAIEALREEQGDDDLS